MKWFKHEASASLDAKLQEVLLDYGLEGYGLYWYCLELISGTVTPDNLTFELEHDARIIARNVGSTVQKVEEMMTKFIELGLFDNDDGVIKCLKLAKKTDEYTAKLLTKSRQTPDKVPTLSGQNPEKSVLIEENRIEEKRREKKANPSSISDLDFSKWPEQPDQQTLKDWFKQRKTKKASNSQTAINRIGKELHKANAFGYSVNECLEKALLRGWTGFEADWMTSSQTNTPRKEL